LLVLTGQSVTAKREFDPQNQLDLSSSVSHHATNPTPLRSSQFVRPSHSKARRQNIERHRHAHDFAQTSPRGDEKGTEDLVPAARRTEASPWEMAGRRESPLMRGGGAGPPLSRGSRIAAAVVVGVALGCLCAFLYPDGLFHRAPDSAIHWPRRVRTRVSASFDPVPIVGERTEDLKV
jgi:hypothetical protein